MFRFIEHISPDEYWFNGWFADQSHEGRRPFVASGSFLNNSGLLKFEGTYRLAQRDTAHPLSMRVLSWGVQAVAIELSAAHLGRMRGHWHFLGDSHELLLSGVTGSYASAHVTLGSASSLQISGALQHAGTALAFEGRGSPGPDLENPSNVVRVLGGRRA